MPHTYTYSDLSMHMLLDPDITGFLPVVIIALIIFSNPRPLTRLISVAGSHEYYMCVDILEKLVCCAADDHVVRMQNHHCFLLFSLTQVHTRAHNALPDLTAFAPYIISKKDTPVLQGLQHRTTYTSSNEVTQRRSYIASRAPIFPLGQQCRISKNAQDLICKMFRGNPAERLTAEQVLQHPWL